MKWGGQRTEEVQFLLIYRGLVFAAIRLFALVTLLISLIVLAASAVTDFFPSTLQGYALILLGPALAICSFHVYIIGITAEGGRGGSQPLDRFDHESVRALLAYKKSGNRYALWLELIKNPAVEGLLFRLRLPQQTLKALYPSPDNGAEGLVAAICERAHRSTQIDVFEVVAVALADPTITNYWQRSHIPIESIEATLNFYGARYRAAKKLRFWTAWTRNDGGFAKLWSTSYTVLLDRFTYVLDSAWAAGRASVAPLIGRNEAVESLLVELRKQNGQNVLLVGDPGVGRSEVLYELASRVALHKTETPFDGMQVRVLDVTAVLSAAPSPEKLGPMFQALFADIVGAGNVILFIPRIELLLSNEGAGSAAAGNLLAQYLGDPRVHIVGSISSVDHVTFVRSQPAVSEKFGVVRVAAPVGNDLLQILLIKAWSVEARYQVFFLIDALTHAIELADRYIKDEASPTREMRLIEEAAAKATAGNRVIAAGEMATVVEERAQVRIRVDENEQEALLNLEAELHQRVIGQNRAIKLLSDALLRARAGLSKGSKPIGTFLFLGPTGVGKTETAKALAHIYFGSEDQMIRLDMSEYATEDGLEKLLGTHPTTQPGALTVAIQQHPSAVVLFDEIEKANSVVRNLMLQLLDEGRLTTNFGKVLDFTNSIVIATSNAGSDYIKEQVEKKVSAAALEKQLIDRLITERTFPPEYLNRFDGVVVYLPLTLAEIQQVVALQVVALQQLVREQKGIELSLSQKVVNELAKRGYDPVFGARALQRVMKNDLETAIARQIIAEKPAPGSTLVIDSL